MLQTSYNKSLDKKGLLVWLVNPYGPVPSEDWREYAYTIIGKWHSGIGHRCVWWTSNYSHHFKCFRTGKLEYVTDLFSIQYISTPGYRSNLSIRRLLRDFIFYLKFGIASLSLFRSQERPDCIVHTSSPMLPFISPSIIGRILSIPVIYYEMDDWLNLLRLSMKGHGHTAHIALEPFLALLTKLKKLELNHADGAIALSSNYLSNLLDLSNSLRLKPHAVVYNSPSSPNLMKNNTRSPVLDNLTQLKARHCLTYAIYCGSMNLMYDIETIIESVVHMRHSRPDIVILFAGIGPLSENLSKFKDIDNILKSKILYLGRLGPDMLSRFLDISDIGICSYCQTSNVDMPDKAYDYLLHGLPIVSSLSGELNSLLCIHKAGISCMPAISESMASALMQLSSSKERLSEYNASILGLSLSQDRQRERYLEVFNSVLDINHIS